MAAPTYFRKAVRSHSMPSRYVLPSEDMGEYEGPSRRRSAPARPAGPLFPLDEEGTYGAPPPGPLPPPAPYKARERKPKVYSSYAVDSGCNVHSKKLVKAEKDHGEVPDNSTRRRRPSWASRRSSASPAPSRRTVSASPSRAGSQDRGGSRASSSSGQSRNSISPEPVIGGRKNSTSGGRKDSTTVGRNPG